MNFLMVALGGGLGAITRYAISLIPIKSQFPFITFEAFNLINDKSYFFCALYITLSVVERG